MTLKFKEELLSMVDDYAMFAHRALQGGSVSRKIADTKRQNIAKYVEGLQERVNELENRLAATDHSDASDLPEFLKPQAD